MKLARSKNIKAGVLQLVTIWPVAEAEIKAAMEQAKAVIVPEMNLGQYIGEIHEKPQTFRWRRSTASTS